MAPELRLLEDGCAVAPDFEASAARWLERNACIRKFLFQLGRQTDGPWLVASNGAVLDFDVHSPGMPARFASFFMVESCFTKTVFNESICSCKVAMSCRWAWISSAT